MPSALSKPIKHLSVVMLTLLNGVASQNVNYLFHFAAPLPKTIRVIENIYFFRGTRDAMTRYSLRFYEIPLRFSFLAFITV